MRNLAWISGFILFLPLVACGDDPSGASRVAGAAGGSGGSTLAASGGASGGMNHDAGAHDAGKHDADGSGGAIGQGHTDGGSAGASGASGSGGQGAHDAGHGGSGGRDGGAGGADASTGKACSDFEMAYANALDAAKTCDAQASRQCQGVVPAGLSCRRCTTYVNDASVLNEIQKQYDQAGCTNDPCLGVLCINPGTGTCAMIDRGDVCQ